MNNWTRMDKYCSRKWYDFKYLRVCVCVLQNKYFRRINAYLKYWRLFPYSKSKDAHLSLKAKRCSKKECCKQCRYVMFKGTMTKWPVQKPTHRTTQNTQNTKKQQTFRKKLFFVFFGIFFSFYLSFLKWVLQEMLSYRLGTVNDFHREFWHCKQFWYYVVPADAVTIRNTSLF